MSVFDIVALVFVLVFVFMGLANGLAKEVRKILVWFGSLIGAKILAYPVSSMMYGAMSIESKLQTRIGNIAEKLDYTSLSALRSSVENGLETIPIVGPLMSGFTKDNWDLTEVFQAGSTKIQTEVAKIMMDGVTPVAQGVMDIAAFVVSFILLFIILSIIFSLVISVFSSIKVVGVIDNILGGMLGLFKGGLFVIFLYSLIFIVLSVTGSDYLSVLMDSKFFDIVVGIKDLLPA